MKKVMVVDEEPRICVLYEEVISGLGHETYFATNATDAWELFKRSRPDLVILDLDMRDGHALETLGRIRALDGDVPLFASSMNPAALKIPAMSAIGVSEVFTKPVDIGLLRLRVERALRDGRLDTRMAK
jgi:DNA-binding response OmpR family regulator